TYPTVAALAGHLAGLLGEAEEDVRAPAAATEVVTEAPAAGDEDGLLELLGATLARARGGRER
ncbi:MAG: hypothetical protein JNK56_28885, partial [Myxococcales bacterium]|nr:hypothetical protein [Myxococcales bacterium]